jgi:hypothetical protein
MKQILLIIILIISFVAYGADTPDGNDDYFFCGVTLIDGSEQDYRKWGKGTDFIYNEANERWEWITEFTYQYIYPDGRYEQIARVDFFEDEIGVCNREMEVIYNQRIDEILNNL